MARTRKSAKTAGASFERLLADHFNDNLPGDIDRLAKRGAADRGDIGPVRDSLQRLYAIEAKDYGGQFRAIPEALAEAEVERQNYGAHFGLVLLKRRGVRDPDRQYVVMEVSTLIGMLKGVEDASL